MTAFPGAVDATFAAFGIDAVYTPVGGVPVPVRVIARRPDTIRDDGLIEGADPTIAALTGRIDVRFADTTLINLAAGGSPVALEFAYTLSAQAKLVLTAHEVYLPKPKLAVEGPGGVQASFDFRGAKNDAAGRMLTVTLTNDLDGLVYG